MDFANFFKNFGLKDEFKEQALKEQPIIENTGKSFPKGNIQEIFSKEQPLQSEVLIIQNKLFDYIKTINEDGIDFFEVFESAQTMGGLTEANLKQAFIFMKIASGNTLTLENVITSGERYKTKLSDLVNTNINEKINLKNSLISNQATEKLKLNQEISDLSKQIKKLTEDLASKEKVLLSIESKYTPEINSIERQITAAESGKFEIINKFEQALTNIKTIKL